MTTAFTAQLRDIASKSTNELDIKAQKAAHAQSLLFDRKIAGSQDIETIYQICLEGFQELYQVDARFRPFEHNLFSSQSKSQDRSQMTAEENTTLNGVLELFLQLLGARILLRPAVKSLEWLVRRFRVHTYNTSTLISAVLPHHETSIFRNVMSILPGKLPSEYRWLSPYVAALTNPPRSAVVLTATTHDAFFATINSFTISAARKGAANRTAASFWGAVITEAISGRLSLAQSGRSEVQRQKQEDLLVKIIPLLNDGLSLQEMPEMKIACYTIIVLLAMKGFLAENIIDSLIETVVLSTTPVEPAPGIVCTSILISQRGDALLSRRTLKALDKIPDFEYQIRTLACQHPVESLLRSITRSLLHNVRKSTFSKDIETVEKLLHITLRAVSAPRSTPVIKAIFQSLFDLDQNNPLTGPIRERLSTMIRAILDSDELGAAFETIVSSSGVDTATLEEALGTVVMPAAEATKDQTSRELEEDSDMDTASLHELDDILAKLPARTVDQQSFLVEKDTPLFDDLGAAHRRCSLSRSGMQRFEDLSIWKTAENGPFLFITFLLRVAITAKSPSVRASALGLIARRIEKGTDFDLQLLIPYICVSLVDEARGVRKATADIIVNISKKLEGEQQNGGTASSQPNLYGSVDQPSHVLTAAQQRKILQNLFLANIEEVVADPYQIVDLIRVALGASAGSDHSKALSTVPEFKKAERTGLFDLIAHHLLVTPLLRVKTVLVQMLEGVDRVGSHSKTKTLIPVLEQWISLDSQQAAAKAALESVELSEIDASLATIISARDIEAFFNLLDHVTQQHLNPRPQLIEAIFQRIVKLWKGVKDSDRLIISDRLFDLATGPQSNFSRNALSVLYDVQLPTEVLINFLRGSREGSDTLKNATPSNKRRRTSRGQSTGLDRDQKVIFQSIVEKLSLALELIDGSRPEQHPLLISELFDSLAVLSILQKAGQSQLHYVTRLCLGSLLAIVKQFRSLPGKMDLDSFAVRADVVTECVRVSQNPEIQQTALLLVAALAEISPSHILHHVMPIFTFMGSSLLRKSDELSVHVVNETLDKVVPALVSASHGKHPGELAESVAELLESFVTAFGHVPSHRRLPLFQRLVSRLGVNGHLHVVVAMLTLRLDDAEAAQSFCAKLVHSFDLGSQLSAINNLLNMMRDILGSLSKSVEVTAGLSQEPSQADKNGKARRLLVLANSFLSSQPLQKKVNKDLEDETATDSRKRLQDIFANIISLRRVVDTSLQPSLEACLESSLQLQPFNELIDSVPTLLSSVETELRPNILVAVQSRLRLKAEKDAKSFTAAIALLPQLQDIVLSETSAMNLKIVAIGCVDQISEHYGRKDVDRILQTISKLSSEKFLLTTHARVKTASVMCLGTMLGVAKEAAVPIVPSLLQVVSELLGESMTEDAEDPLLHNSCMAVLSEIAIHCAFILSDDNISQIFELCSDSANCYLTTPTHTIRQDLLQVLSGNLELPSIVSALIRTWNHVMENGLEAVKEAFDLLEVAIDRSTKSTVIKSTSSISGFIIGAADLRRVQLTVLSEDSYPIEEIDEIESKLHELCMKFVYKINDNILRPLFGQWVDWAIECADLQSSPANVISRGKTLRQITLFNFLTYFFSTLKSIVTSYASFIIPPAISILNAALTPLTESSTFNPLLDPDGARLYTSALSCLNAALSHDQDSFSSSPDLFTPLSTTLVNALTLASASSPTSAAATNLIQEILIPTILSLAHATQATSESSHKALNRLLCSPTLRHHASAVVRSAMVRTQLTLAQDEEVGMEWCEQTAREGETMVCVNEMLEDDDPGVERGVRRWVVAVRERVGEDLFG